jgi:prepilin-type N-terminal cleavage/methylation domain-containing protein
VSARGFTLLETLVALGITALVLGALGGAVLRAATARARATDVAGRGAVTRTLLLRLVAELEAARAPLPGDAEGAERLVVDADDPTGPWSTLHLATAVRSLPATRAPASDVRALAYHVEPDAARPGVGTLVRADDLPGAAVSPALPVLDGVRRFRIRCFDGNAWRSTWGAPRLPRAVEVILGVDDGRGGVEELAITVALPVAG